MTSVLVVDDNDLNRKLAVDVLSAAGFRTFGAATAEQGIALAVEHVPDVILMDLRLPDMDGVDAMGRLAAARAHGSHPGGRDERVAARGERRLARGGRLRRMAREADPREHVSRAGSPLLRRESGVTRLERPYRASTPRGWTVGQVGRDPLRSLASRRIGSAV